MMLSGCASIVSGVNQPVSVETKLNGESLVGAACKLSSNKGTWFVTTPGQVMLHRGYQDLSITCEKSGLASLTTTASSHVRAIAFGNILFGGIIGVAVDAGDGAAFDYDDLISIEMGTKPVHIEGMLEPISPPPPSTPAIIISSPSPTPVASTAPGAVNLQSTPVATTVQPSSATVSSLPSSMPSTPPIATSGRQELRYKIAAETYAKSQVCTTTPVASLVAVGPGYETYAIPCGSGESLMARCDFGNCRSLK